MLGSLYFGKLPKGDVVQSVTTCRWMNPSLEEVTPNIWKLTYQGFRKFGVRYLGAPIIRILVCSVVGKGTRILEAPMSGLLLGSF